MELTIENYKLGMANDMIIFLIAVLTYDTPQTKKSEKVDDIINKWLSRVERGLGNIRESQIKELSEKTGDSEDVTRLLSEALDIPNVAIRKEFANEIKALTEKYFNLTGE